MIIKFLNKVEANYKFGTDYEWQGAWEVLRHQVRRLIYPFLWQLAIIAFDSLTIYFLILGLGLHLGFMEVVLGLMATKIVATIAFTPGALVFFEGGMVLFYTLLGLPAAGAFLVTMIFRALSFWLPMPAGLILYRKLSKK